MLKLWENPMLSIEERLEVASGEIERLQGLTDAVRNAVEKANEQAERFEREWYLRGDALDEALDTFAHFLRDWLKTHNAEVKGGGQ